MIFSYIAGPLIGAVIGYCTNYIAVKMLFYPKKEIRICGRRLPFTPGAIPRGKPRLAGAIGNIVADKLLTEEDIADQIFTEQTEEKIVSMASGFMEKDIKGEILSASGIGEDSYIKGREKLSLLICDKALDSLQEVGIGEIFAEKGGEMIREKTKGTMLEMFLSDDMINAITTKGSEEVRKFISRDGMEYIRPVVDKELERLESMSSAELFEKMEIGGDKQEEILRSIYRNAVRNAAKDIIGNLNISNIIKEKINEMDIDELEELVLTVMKKELDTIVNLGALIGCLLGIINIFF